MPSGFGNRREDESPDICRLAGRKSVQVWIDGKILRGRMMLVRQRKPWGWTAD